MIKVDLGRGIQPKLTNTLYRRILGRTFRRRNEGRNNEIGEGVFGGT